MCGETKHMVPTEHSHQKRVGSRRWMPKMNKAVCRGRGPQLINLSPALTNPVSGTDTQRLRQDPQPLACVILWPTHFELLPFIVKHPCPHATSKNTISVCQKGPHPPLTIPSQARYNHFYHTPTPLSMQSSTDICCDIGPTIKIHEGHWRCVRRATQHLPEMTHSPHSYLAHCQSQMVSQMVNLPPACPPAHELGELAI